MCAILTLCFIWIQSVPIFQGYRRVGGNNLSWNNFSPKMMSKNDDSNIMVEVVLACRCFQNGILSQKHNKFKGDSKIDHARRGRWIYILFDSGKRIITPLSLSYIMWFTSCAWPESYPYSQDEQRWYLSFHIQRNSLIWRQGGCSCSHRHNVDVSDRWVYRFSLLKLHTADVVTAHVGNQSLTFPLVRFILSTTLYNAQEMMFSIF